VNQKLKFLQVPIRLLIEEVELLVLKKTPMFHLILENTQVEFSEYVEFMKKWKGIVLYCQTKKDDVKVKGQVIEKGTEVFQMAYGMLD
jgi:hypothetical protein